MFRNLAPDLDIVMVAPASCNVGPRRPHMYHYLTHDHWPHGLTTWGRNLEELRKDVWTPGPAPDLAL